MPSTRTTVGLAAAIVALLVLVAAGFASVDASALQGQAAVQSAVSTARANDATATLAGPIALYVEGHGWLQAALADQVEAALEAHGATVTRVDSLATPTDGPVLAVRVTDASVGYRPISPRADLSVAFAYVQSGNATLAEGMLGSDPVIIRSHHDAYVVGGDLTIADRTNGVVTWPAYRRRVSNGTAAAIVDGLAGAAGMDGTDF